MVVIEQAEARNGQPTLKALLPDGRTRFIHSSYDPGCEAEDWARQLDEVKGNHLLVLFGLGLGYHLRALNAINRDNNLIFVVEPSAEVVRLARKSEVAGSLLRQSHIHLVQDWASFKQIYERIGDRWQSPIFFKVPAYTQVYAKQYQDFVLRFQRELTSLLVDIHTVVASSQVWQLNFLKNLRYLKETTPAASIFGQFQSKPLIIVSAGPSLSKNIDVLRRAQGRALILAVGTVTKALLQNDITPDLIVSFDGHTPNYFHHFKGLELPGVPLVFDPTVHYRIVEEWKGPKCVMLNNPTSCWLERRLNHPLGYVKMGPSIANTAFALACRLKADPIILVGQDLAYTDRTTHFAGTHDKSFRYDVPDALYESKPIPENYRTNWKDQTLVWVESVDGNQVATDRKMLTFLHWFENNIRGLAGDCRVIDATEGGARIPETEILSLSETLQRYAPEDLSAPIDQIKHRLSDPPPFDLDGFIAYLRHTRNVINTLAAQCRRGTRLSRQLVAHYSNGKKRDPVKIEAQLGRIDRRLKEAGPYLDPIHFLVHPILAVASHFGGGEEESAAAIQRESQLMYQRLHEAFEQTVPLLEETIESLDPPRRPRPVHRPVHPWVRQDFELEARLREVALQVE